MLFQNLLLETHLAADDPEAQLLASSGQFDFQLTLQLVNAVNQFADLSVHVLPPCRLMSIA